MYTATGRPFLFTGFGGRGGAPLDPVIGPWWPPPPCVPPLDTRGGGGNGDADRSVLDPVPPIGDVWDDFNTNGGGDLWREDFLWSSPGGGREHKDDGGGGGGGRRICIPFRRTLRKLWKI